MPWIFRALYSLIKYRVIGTLRCALVHRRHYYCATTEVGRGYIGHMCAFCMKHAPDSPRPGGVFDWSRHQ